MDRATYEQLDRIEDQNNEIMEALASIQQRLGISIESDNDYYDEDEKPKSKNLDF
jgi:hypothetical protein